MKERQAVIIGKVVTKLQKSAKKDSQVSKSRRSKCPVEPEGSGRRLSETSEIPNGDPREEIFHERAESNAAAGLEEGESSDLEYWSCSEQ